MQSRSSADPKRKGCGGLEFGPALIEGRPTSTSSYMLCLLLMGMAGGPLNPGAKQTLNPKP